MYRSNIEKQRGLTLISWVIILVYILFQAVIAMRVIPVYIADESVKTVLKALPTDVEAQGLTTKRLKILIEKRIRMNNVYSIKPDYIEVKKGRGENIVTINYQPRGPLIGNLEYVVKFHHEVKVPLR